MRRFFRNLFGTRAATRNARLGVEALETRDLMAVGVLSSALAAQATTLVTLTHIDPGPWIDQNIHDTNIHFLVRWLDSDYQLGRGDVMAILQVVSSDAAQHGGLSSTELSDLETLVYNPTTLGMPDYVQNLLNKVVNADPANATYQGAGLEFGATGLQTGSPAWMLRDLTDKWFMGGDSPALPTDLKYSGGQPMVLHYQYAAGSLFGSGANSNDVMQGVAGDCYYMASLEETVIQAPQIINNMFIDNGDGTYTVRFYHNGTPDYVTVDRYLPADKSGNFAFANMGYSVSDPSNKLWVALAEKAYAQLDESGWNLRGAGKQENSYRSLDGGWSYNAMPQITGKASTYGNLTGPTSLTATTIENDFLAGHLITFTTSGDPNHYVASYIVPNHVYSMVGFFSNNGGIFVLDNPWSPKGSDKSKVDTVVLTLDQMIANGFVAWEEVNLHPLPYTNLGGVAILSTQLVATSPARGASAPAGQDLPGVIAPAGISTPDHTADLTDSAPGGTPVTVSTARYFQGRGNNGGGIHVPAEVIAALLAARKTDTLLDSWS